jgi:iron complex outermembrane receptor protein
MIMKRILGFVALALLCIHASAQFSLTGKVYDSNGEKLSGANVFIGGKQVSITNLEGQFKLDGFKSESIELTISFSGFENYVEVLQMTENKQLDIVMHGSVTKFEEVVVSAIRAQKNTPTTYSYLLKKDLSKISSGQDAPYLLGMEPSVVVSSDAGTGIGYTSMHIRGSDNKKINVTINGVPLNDPESHGVYWVDVPDITSSAQSIQVQRGVGTSTNGSGAFGASINMLTDNISAKPFIEYSGLMGSYNTNKNSIQLSTGIIKNHWFLEGKLGQIKSDGYRDRASSDLRNYFAQAGYTSEKTIIKLLSFGGYEETYQAWYGIDKATLETNRTYNPAGLIGQNAFGKDTFYNKMVDHYQQDHLQLHFAHRFNNEISFNAALHYTYGRGYYQDYVPSSWGMPLSGFNIPNIIRGVDTIQYSDLIHRLWLQNHFYGGVWSVNYIKDKYSITWGGGVNNYTPAKHFGEVIWAKESEIKLNGINYYENEAKKSDWNNYLKLNYSVLEQLNLFADLQLRGIQYKAWGTSKEYEDRDIRIDENYLFFNPKFGALYQFDSKSSIYGSFAIANREPNRSDFLGAPAGEVPNHETLNDLEIGVRHSNKLFNAELVIYNMDYRNQLVLTGELDGEGTPLRQNVKSSYRQGIELSLEFKPTDYVKFDENISISSNKINNYPIQDSIGAAVVLKTQNIAYSPSVIMGQKLTIIPIKDFELAFLGKYVGKQYLDNSQSDARSLDGYFVFDFLTNYSIDLKKNGKLDLFFKINNLLNEKYVSNGSISWGSPVYFPQAKQNILIGLTYRF